jgi:hypothetical protein
MNPLFPIEYIIISFGVITLLGTYLSWRSSSLAPPHIRKIITVLRFLAMLSLALIAFDPGYWKVEKNEYALEWAVMLDSSSSMEVQDVDKNARYAKALELSKQLLTELENVKIYPFSKNLLSGVSTENELKKLKPTGVATDITGAGTQLLKKYNDTGKTLKGIMIISDGRETIVENDKNFPLLARAKNIPLHGVCLGGKVAEKDLLLKLPHRNYTIFKGQTQKIALRVINKNLGKIKTKVQLVDKTGKTIEEKEIMLDNNTGKLVNFTLKLKTPGHHELWLKTPKLTEEKIFKNNKIAVNATVIDEKLKILMVEGRPYWDSKFLSQVLRKNTNIQFTGIYRLSSERFFLIGEGNKSGNESTSVIFPETLEGLAKYNLIIFGKGAEFFLNDDRISILKSYIRDYGGAVLFARGKPYSGEWRGLSSIEPVYWGEMLNTDFHWKPTSAGEAYGLFGEMLPGPDSTVWAELPIIENAYRCPELKSFAEVLLVGNSEKTKLNVPVLINRKFGKGIVLAVNSEGLWKWDFFPLKGETGDFYKKFWTQLVFWAVKYSDFLPDQDYSILLSNNAVLPDEEVIVQINTRKKYDKNLNLTLKITKDDKLVKKIVPSASAGRGWNGMFAIYEPGRYKISLNIPEHDVDNIFAMLDVKSPPKETDNLSAAPNHLESIVKQGGGTLIDPDELIKTLKETKEKQPEEKETDKQWVSSWSKWWFLIALLGFLSVEVYLRRRNGML